MGCLNDELPRVPTDPSTQGNGTENIACPIRLYRLHVVVEELGGHVKVMYKDLWNQVVSKMFPWLDRRISSERSPSANHDDVTSDKSIEQLESAVKKCYERYLLPYILDQAEYQSNLSQNDAKSGLDPLFDLNLDELLTESIKGYSDGMYGSISGELGSAEGIGCAEAARKEAESVNNLSSFFNKFVVSQSLTKDENEEVNIADCQDDGDAFNSTGERKRRSRQQNPRYMNENFTPIKKGKQRHLHDDDLAGSEASGIPSSSRSSIRYIMRRQRQTGRYCRRKIPEPKPGSSFYRYYRDIDKVFRGYIMNDRFDIEYYDKQGVLKHIEKGVDFDSLQMLVASGETEALAREALIEGICQECSRADYPENMILCDNCNYGFHVECLQPPLRNVPSGDWFCSICLSDEDEDEEDQPSKTSENNSPSTFGIHKTLASFGYGDGDEYCLEDFRALGDLIKHQYFEKAKLRSKSQKICGLSENGVDDDKALELEYWKFVSETSRSEPDLVDMRVYYGSDLDTGELGSGFPTPSTVKSLQERANKLEAKYASLTNNNMKRSPAFQSQAADILNELTEAKHRVAQFERYASDGWNLGVFPKLPGSLLKFVDEDITGVIVPWLYIGMFFSSFCWHTEDHYFASINYHHFGAPKTWYGVPATGAPAFENAALKLTPELFKARKDILTGIVTQYNPSELAKLGVPVCHLTQRPGEFVLTFPQAYHGGFNHGLNCAEAVNFATTHWLPFGVSCVNRYCSLQKTPVISHSALLLSVVISALQSRESDDSDTTDAVSMLMSVFPALENLLTNEKRLHERCKQTIPNISVTVVSDDCPGDLVSKINDGAIASIDAAHECGYPQSQGNGERNSDSVLPMPNGLGSPRVTRSQGANNHSTKVVYGRERAHHMSRIKSNTPHVQCEVCNKFCSLSFVRRIDHHSSNTQILCLDHAIEQHEGIKTEDKVELVVVWSSKKLTILRAETNLFVAMVDAWRKIIDSAYQEGQEDQVIDKDKMVSISKSIGAQFASMVENQNGNDFNFTGLKLAPSALSVLNKCPNGNKIPIAKDIKEALRILNDIIDAAPLFSICQSSSELVALTKIHSCCSEFVEVSTEYEKSDSSTRVELSRLLDVLARSELYLSDWSPWKKLSGVREGALAWIKRAEIVKKKQEMYDLLDELDNVLRLRVDGIADKLKLQIDSMAWSEKVEFTLNRHAQRNISLRNVCLPSLKDAESILSQYRAEFNMPHVVDRIRCELSNTQKWIVEAEQAVSSCDYERLYRLHTDCHHSGVLTFAPPKVVCDTVASGFAVVNDWVQEANMVFSKLQQNRATEDMVFDAVRKGTSSGISMIHPMPALKSLASAITSWRMEIENLLCVFRPMRPAIEEKGNWEYVEQADAVSALLLRAARKLHPWLLTGDWRQSNVDYTLKPVANDNKKRICACRTEIKGNEFLLLCNGCGEKYHPQCLSTSNKHAKGLEDFYCPTCIYDGKAIKRKKSRNTSTYCTCGNDYDDDMVMVQCEACDNWFHPLCVGICGEEAKKMDHYFCPDCCFEQSRKPLVKLYCECRKVDFGTGAVSGSMLCCDLCGNWYHPVCIGMAEDAIQRHASSRTSFYCLSCCNERDVPYNRSDGISGYISLDKLLASIAHKMRVYDTHIVVRSAKNTNLTVQFSTRCTLDQLESCLETSRREIPLRVKETEPLEKLVLAGKRWFAEAAKLGLSKDLQVPLSFLQLKSNDLWSLLFMATSLPIILPPLLITGIEIELWGRFLVHLSKSSRNIEAYLVSDEREAFVGTEEDLRIPRPALLKLRNKVFLELANGCASHVPEMRRSQLFRCAIESFMEKSIQAGPS